MANHLLHKVQNRSSWLMTSIRLHSIRTLSWITLFTLSTLTAFSQQPPDARSSDETQGPSQDSSGNRGWRRATDPPPADSQANPPVASPSWGHRPLDEYGQSGGPGDDQQGRPAGPPPNYQQGGRANYQPSGPVPAELVMRPGTFVTVRLDRRCLPIMIGRATDSPPLW